MKQEDKQYEQWLEQVKSTLPEIEKPEELTREILQRIERIPRKKKLPEIGYRLLAAASALLLCLMVYETVFYPSTLYKEKKTHTLETCSPPRKIPEFSNMQLSNMTMREKSSCLSKLWKEYTETQKQQKRTISRIIHQEQP